ncbi:bifunctional DnaQ family exonuclease/ATP-dependent helicase [Streptococcus sp. sy018]|uniref:bifunctional DnaQ family exonuclease/ATP-dependent helicase n=1 Tax=Streptococcus sp. sy018 TaxID=2600147 RepID=UPI0011B53AE2|nr:bifunctional DnaQ family exonuclease/ATP-dependent helicase [Streptococcus sp. sy018]TWS95381.1 bifunctional DnaQ family exonuclease/ATP-dependent helicase [Streptococcus sp. sy018]
MKVNKLRKYAVVDLEATGTAIDSSIIQVGIVIIENGQITETFETDVNPHQPLDEHIISLTGITDEQLSVAPEFSQVASRIYELIKDAIFVAHNVKFDANLLTEQLFWEGYELRQPRVDTVELSQVFFPTLEKYSLAQLASALEVRLNQAHTAIADAQATAEIFLMLQEKIRQLPQQTLQVLKTFSHHLLYESHLIIDEILEEKMREDDLDQYELVEHLMLKKSLPLAKEKELARNFTDNLKTLGLDVRPKQEAFAQLIEQGLALPEPSLIQAPTGIGKSLGYLLPLLSQGFKEQLVVAVPTKTLQDQLYYQEAAWLRNCFNLSSQSIKAARNYIKLEYFQKSLETPESNRLLNRYKMRVLVWLAETQTGDLDEIRQQQGMESFFEALRHDGRLDVYSPFYEMDFWRRAQEKAKTSRLLITNHAYLLEESKERQNFITNKVLVIDEAQAMLATLEAQTHQRLNLTQLLSQIKLLLDEITNHLQQRLLESLQFELEQVVNGNESYCQEQLELRLPKLRQDLSELDLVALQPLAKALSEDFPLVWLEKDELNEPDQIILHSSQKELVRLTELIKPKKLYLISSSLQISQEVNLADLLQLESYHFERLPSERTTTQHIYLPRDLPDIRSLSQEQYALFLAEKLVQLVQLDYPILALFTSKKMMLKVSDLLDEVEVNHLCQYKNGQPFGLKKRFDREKNGLLLGTGTFWEGVDFKEQDRLLTIITQLPFENPKDCFSQKIYRELEQKGQNPFMSYTLPMMLLRLIQAFGRSQRRPEQKSAILILDQRLLSRSYSSTILDYLEDNFQLEQGNFIKILPVIAEFLI